MHFVVDVKPSLEARLSCNICISLLPRLAIMLLSQHAYHIRTCPVTGTVPHRITNDGAIIPGFVRSR